MRKILGIALIAAGMVVAAWVGVYLCMVDGIIEAVRGATAHPVSVDRLGWGVARVAGGTLVVWVSAVVFGGAALVVRHDAAGTGTVSRSPTAATTSGEARDWDGVARLAVEIAELRET